MEVEIPPELDRERLHDLVAGDPFVTRLEFVDVVDSTNDTARRLASLGAPSGTSVVAREQVRGRGRRGRDWASPPGLGLYVSTLIRSRRPPAEWTRWTLGAAVAACEACRRITGAPVTIKWPNDILCDGKKLCGILTESRGDAGGGADLVVGTGFNLFHREEDFPESLRRRATSLQRCAAQGMLRPPEALLACYLKELGRVSELLEEGRWEPVALRFVERSPGVCGRRVRVGGENGYTGLTDGLDGDGALRVERGQGRVDTVHLAESVREMES